MTNTLATQTPARGLPPEVTAPSTPWITDREPTDADYPVLVRYEYSVAPHEAFAVYQITGPTKGRIPVKLVGTSHAWMHWKDIAPPPPVKTLTQKDEEAAKAYRPPYEHDITTDRRAAFLAGIKYARANLA